MDWSKKEVWTLQEFFDETESMYPKIEALIESQQNFAKYILSNPKNIVLRSCSGFPTRGRVYLSGDINIGTSDNEACCGFYESLYHGAQDVNADIFAWFRNRNVCFSGRVDEEPEPSSTNSVGASKFGLKGGINKGKPFRSDFDLKLSHYLSAAEKLDSSSSYFMRAARFLSPLNIILTPKTKRKDSGYHHSIISGRAQKLWRNDLGETDFYLKILHLLLAEKVYSHKDGQKAYEMYSKICQSPFSFTSNDFSDAKKVAKSVQVRFEKNSEPGPSIYQSAMSDANIQKNVREHPNFDTHPGVVNLECFSVGQRYSAGDISSRFGGNPMAALPERDGRILFARFNCGDKFNPEGPEILGIHNGPVQTRAAECWQRQGAIPFFFRDGGTGLFEYLGLAEAEVIYRGQDALDYAQKFKYPNFDQVGLIIHVTLLDSETAGDELLEKKSV